MRLFLLILILLINISSIVSQSNRCSLVPVYTQIPGKVYLEDQNLMALDLMELYSDILANRPSERKVLFHFFIDELSPARKSAEQFMKLLKDSLAKLKTDIEVIFRIQRTTGNLFLNKGEHKFSLVGMNALVFSTDSLVLKELFGYGKKSRIDTTSSSVKRFNHEFLPVFNEPDSNQGYLFLFRTRTTGRGFACNPEEDKEIASLLKLIYKKNCK